MATARRSTRSKFRAGQLARLDDGTLVDILEISGDWATVKAFGNPVRYDRLVSTLKAVR